jgi:hypothetical protein
MEEEGLAQLLGFGYCQLEKCYSPNFDEPARRYELMAPLRARQGEYAP